MESSSKRSSVSLIPTRPASASKWITAFVEPPKASTVVIAFSNEELRKISRGLRSSHTISTIRRPERLAILMWLESTAGIALAPARVKPRTSATLVMVDAVPMVMQVPADRAIPSSISFHACRSILPARRSAQYLATSDPLPKICPCQLPRSMGPAGTKMAGIFMLIAPIRSAGVVLSQPPSRTHPSAG